jgi:hypothetical protein
MSKKKSKRICLGCGKKCTHKTGWYTDQLGTHWHFQCNEKGYLQEFHPEVAAQFIEEGLGTPERVVAMVAESEIKNVLIGERQILERKITNQRRELRRLNETLRNERCRHRGTEQWTQHQLGREKEQVRYLDQRLEITEKRADLSRRVLDRYHAKLRKRPWWKRLLGV